LPFLLLPNFLLGLDIGPIGGPDASPMATYLRNLMNWLTAMPVC
jgi:hypothetical protein